MSVLDTLTKSLVEVYASALTEQEQTELLEALEIVANDEKYNKFSNIFPDEGEYKRELYRKHLQFFEAGAKYRERGFIAGNRVGKSQAGAFETTCHATGLYPEWWTGRRFSHPPTIWVGGDTATTCRDIIQQILLGNVGDFGSGMIPKDCIVETKTRRNVPDAIETIRVKHVTGGVSTIVIKTYEQGRASWQGTSIDFIWIDEECPQEVYGEALMRTMTTGGSTILTFTPLSGLTDLVMNFLENSQETDTKYPKYVCTVSWDDVPHIKKEAKEEMLAATPPQLRDARSKGEPTVGSGRIYPISSEHYIVDDFQVPKYWRKAYGFDIGWNNTAAVFGAWDEANDIIYIYSEYKQGESQPVVHASAIKARGEWLKGVIDPAARGRSQIDGTTIFSLYKQEGLKLYLANNAVEAGIYEVWDRLNTGRLKIFKSCTAIQKEFNLYIRDEKGKIVKKNDHLLDALRYLCLSDRNVWSFMPSSMTQQNKVVDMRQYMAACT
jgi:phage terminase large subunit-like protein